MHAGPGAAVLHPSKLLTQPCMAGLLLRILSRSLFFFLQVRKGRHTCKRIHHDADAGVLVPELKLFISKPGSGSEFGGGYRVYNLLSLFFKKDAKLPNEVQGFGRDPASRGED